jgi:hypothetical protein
MFNAALFLAGTAYDKLLERVDALRFLRSWILVTLRRASDSARSLSIPVVHP